MADHTLAPCPLQQVDIWEEQGHEALSRALGFTAPREMGQVTEQSGIRAARLSPRRFWIMGSMPPVALAPEDGATVPLDEGRVMLSLPGTDARAILPQLMAIDWASPHAASGRLVLSAIHRVPVAVLPLADGRFEIIMPRSFAESILELIAEQHRS